jgi:signal transduction histidine kinase/CheY-like chemotaxis protein
METTPSYMMTSGEAAAVDFISVSLANWLGIPDRDLVRGRPLLDLFMGEMKTMFQEVMEESGYVEKNFEVNIGDKTFWFVLRSSIMDNDKRSRFFEWWDVTPIIEAKNEAVAAARAKSDFLANVSHEIRTPMNAILGMTELMMMNSLEPEQIERASAIKIASMSLLEIVNDILDFSKIDARKMEIIIKPFDFPSFINDTVNLVNIKASGAGLAFTTNIAHDIPPLVNGDELRLKQSLLNILNNAVKFTKSGSISLRVWREPLVNGAMKLNFSVKDTGIGIKSEDIGKLFGVFQQLDTRKNRQIMGTGLGLAITKSLVEMMGGAVTAESVYGKGTTFSFYVLCEGPHRGSLAVIPDPGILRVLCYEPNIYNARAFREMLDDLAVPRDVCIDIAEASKFLNKNIYTHVFFDSSAKAVVTGFRYKQGTRFIQLKEVTDKNEGDFDGFINRPVLVTTLANTLTGQETATSRLHSDDTKTGSFQTSGVRILVVDDNPVNLLVAKGLLREYGIDVETAASGQDAIAMVKETEYDIIFMDHMMPGMDGLDATKAIRALGGRHQNGIIIALTANAVADAQKLFRQAGMDDFLSKPIIISNLRQMLLRHLPKEKIL